MLAVQFFDIARLTTHAVPLVPGTFVAISGKGPKGDSNGSGKTSFLIALSLLLCDPQWRMEVNGGKPAAGILFRSEAAGLEQEQAASIRHGYIVGVFAQPDAPEGTALTVWMRISGSPPFVQARWTDGLHVATSEDDVTRSLEADDLWKGLPSAGTLSARAMAETLYGNAPRCLTYLDTALRSPVPSLLSQQMTELEPSAIGTSLISLAGMRHLLEDEARERGKQLTAASELKEAQAAAESARIEEDRTLHDIAARGRARDAVDQARDSWRLYLAAAVKGAYVRDSEIGEAVTIQQAKVEEASQSCSDARGELMVLEAEKSIEPRARAARTEWGKEAHLLKDRERSLAQSEARLNNLRIDHEGTTPQVDGWNGTTVDQAQSDVECCVQGLVAAQTKLQASQNKIRDVEAVLERVRLGRAGVAGQGVDILEQAGVFSAALLDQIQLADESRGMWEPRLWPWRDAVVVAPRDAEAARAELAVLPGVQVVAADDTACVQPLPPGVGSDWPITGFLNTLAQRTHHLTAPDSAHDPGLDLTQVGGFREPVAGRAARLRAAQEDVDQARIALAGAESAATTAATARMLAEAHLKAAQAVERLNELKGEIDREETTLEKARTAVVLARKAEEMARDTLEKVQAEQASYVARVETLRLTVQVAEKTHTEERHKAAAMDRDREAVALNAWLGCFGGSVAEATAALDQASIDGVLPSKSQSLTASLRRGALEHLRDAVRHYGPPEVQPQILLDAAEQRDRLADSDGKRPPAATAFDDCCAPLTALLDSAHDRDRTTATRVTEARVERERAIDALADSATTATHNLVSLQDMIERHLDALFARISSAFDSLSRRRGEDGATLAVSRERPDGSGEWRWEVTPQWKRSAHGPHVSYREVANSAQVKVNAIGLVLAALLADSDSHGRLLILDELGNSLGEVNRKDVLTSLGDVAREHQITVLGTCQDSVLSDAADVCGELIWFSHPDTAFALNRPTQAWGYSPHSGETELTAFWIQAGRDHDQ
ncbi:hypothetical protein ACFZBU_27220 [Embleya sp. NPDC008237]|uniref:hypothetical protein n=1 Tax=Embleya sp. NPDC008237 TaxID=3363978 RepID=UPI0036F07044